MVETISREEAAWLAGILDGEGCIAMCPCQTHGGRLRGKRLEINVTNIDPRLIQKVSELWEKLGAKFSFIYHKQSKSLRITAAGYGTCERILRLVHEFLINKKEQSQLVLDFIEYHRTLPRYFHHIPELLEAFIGRQTLVHQTLKEMHQRRFFLQRLQRTASKRLVLDDGIVWPA